MSNPFIDIIKEAVDKKWCTKVMCTTCGAVEFRKKLKELAGPNGDNLVVALEDVDLHELSKYDGWSDCIRHAYELIRNPSQGDRVLKAWLPRIENNLRVGDVVLYYIIKKGILFSPMSMEMRNAWVDACAEYAIKYKDGSLLESLAYIIVENAKYYEGIKAALTDLSTNNVRYKKALNKMKA